MAEKPLSIRSFLDRHFRHFNAASVVQAAKGYSRHLESGGRMMVTLAGAMSTAELGLSLAEMIRRDMVHAISCTGANLEEDLFNLLAHERYESVPHWRNLTPVEEKELETRGLNRVTDTCIPEDAAIRALERPLLELWRAAERRGARRFPHQYLYELLLSGRLEECYEIDPADSWMVAAAERDLPLFVPGWEDSTLGNIFAARLTDGSLSRWDLVKSGPEYMGALIDWYLRETMGRGIADIERTTSIGEEKSAVDLRTVRPDDAVRTIGFFQVGGGIAGDFAICVVPLIHQDLDTPCPYWGYFCQISDSTTSYGSYSGALPTEKITWGKLDVDTPMYLIESDATIVAPLIFAHVLGW